jgi:hypothetical protein
LDIIIFISYDIKNTGANIGIKTIKKVPTNAGTLFTTLQEKNYSMVIYPTLDTIACPFADRT